MTLMNVLRHPQLAAYSIIRPEVARRAVWLVMVALLIGCEPSPTESKLGTIGGASISAMVQTPMLRAAARLAVETNAKPRTGQFMIADILTYGGKATVITAPPTWTLLRDDSTISVRQSLYVHAVGENDSGSAAWTFSRPVDAQAVTLLLDNVSLEAPVDVTNGDTGTLGLIAKPVTTSSDGDLILVFFATDFQGTGLGAQVPLDMIVIAMQEAKPLQYWVLGTYQSSKGETDTVRCPTGQLYNSIGAQVAIRRKIAPMATSSN